MTTLFDRLTVRRENSIYRWNSKNSDQTLDEADVRERVASEINSLDQYEFLKELSDELEDLLKDRFQPKEST